MPQFSIVMPTRNRGELLALSIQTALRQTVDDFEVVVIDNNSGDSTPEVVREAGDPRIRYIRGDITRAMTDNWEFALQHAQGDYVTYLCDDDALHPRALEVAYDALQVTGTEVATWASAAYYHDSWYDAAQRGKAVLPTTSGDYRVVDGPAALASFYDLRLDAYVPPKMLNSLSSRRVIRSVLERQGRMFIGCAPDFAACVALVEAAGKYVYIDRSLNIWGASAKSIGAQHARPEEALQAYIEECSGVDAMYARMPLRCTTAMNNISQSFLAVQEMERLDLKGYPFNWARYFTLNYEELLTRQRNGVDIERDVSELWDALKEQPLPIRTAVTRRLAKWKAPNRPLRWATAALTDPGWVLYETIGRSLTRSRKQSVDSSTLKTVDMTTHGVRNIVECAAALSQWEPPVVLRGLARSQ